MHGSIGNQRKDWEGVNMKKMFDRQENPAALLKVMPCFRGQNLPVAVFIKYHNSQMWQQISKEYWYKKCAENKARSIEIAHFAYKNLSNPAYS